MNNYSTLFSLLEYIPTPAYRNFTEQVLLSAPTYFWTKPSSAGKYHPPDEHGLEGLLLHTIRVVRIGVILCDLSPRLDPNVVLPACFLHDTRRYGNTEKGSRYSLSNHPELAADFIKGFDSITIDTSDIALAVETHTGRWGKASPRCENEWAVHYADCIAAKYF